MARSPADPYYTQPIDLTPKAKEPEWSWEEFLGGLAEGGLKGLSVGINLQEMRDKERTRRLAALKEDPDFYLSLYDSRKKLENPIVDDTVPSSQIPGRDEFPSGITTLDATTADYPGMGIPERTTPEEMGLDLRAAKEARDREIATRRLAQSPEAESFMKDITDTEAKTLRAIKATKASQLVGESIKKASTEFVSANSALKTLSAQRNEVEAKLRAANDAGDEETAAALQSTVELLKRRGFEQTVKLQEARAALMEHGLTKEDWNKLIVPGQSQSAIDELIFKVTRGHRTRRPGSK